MLPTTGQKRPAPNVPYARRGTSSSSPERRCLQPPSDGQTAHDHSPLVAHLKGSFPVMCARLSFWFC